MCYSAMIQADYDKFCREAGAIMSLEEFAANVWARPGRRIKWPRTMENWFQAMGTPQADEIFAEIQRQRDAKELELQQEIFTQTRRKADAERQLQSKTTKKLLDELRIASKKVRDAESAIKDLHRTEHLPKDDRFYPDMYAPVVIMENGRRVVKPMRYRIRPPGWTPAVEREYSNAYNARRDKLLERPAWKRLFGKRHGLLLTPTFFERVDRHAMEHRALRLGEKVESVELRFNPRQQHTMVVPCFWNESPDGDFPLLSFAALTDDPAPEVEAAGHDRTIIEIRPERGDDWLVTGKSPEFYQEVLDDRPETYYEYAIEKEAA